MTKIWEDDKNVPQTDTKQGTNSVLQVTVDRLFTTLVVPFAYKWVTIQVIRVLSNSVVSQQQQQQQHVSALLGDHTSNNPNTFVQATFID